VTLKAGVENMMTYYVPEVKGVEEWKDEPLEKVSNDAFKDLEAKLAQAKRPEVAN